MPGRADSAVQQVYPTAAHAHALVTHHLPSPQSMTHPQQENVTRLLDALRDGDRSVLDELFRLVYDELRTLAHQKRIRWQGDFTLNTTAIVHEAYLKLVDGPEMDLKSRAHFFAVAARAMRHILINYAELRQAKKRGGDVKKISLDEDRGLANGVIDLTEEHTDKLVSLEQALKKLEIQNKRLVRIVECKFFGGMTNEETAEALEISKATVKRGWLTARSWLFREIATG